jgi:hypothetical protein
MQYGENGIKETDYSRAAYLSALKKYGILMVAHMFKDFKLLIKQREIH